MTTRSKSNPFAQSEFYWKTSFTLPAAAVSTAEQSFDDLMLSVSAFETDEANHVWTMELLAETEPDRDEIARRLMVLSALHDVAIPKVTVEKLEQQDWLARVARDFPPLAIGRFYLHGSHAKEAPPYGSISIQVDAGAAFGSGEHGTTRCCLEAMDWLAKKRDYSRILDMGCGSGVLAIAAAKLWKHDVLAADIDPIAVRVTQENAQKNHEQNHVTAVVSDGYSSERIRRGGPYDLIVSNILARPLIAFAPDLAANLDAGGTAILSGLLTSQETQVLSAHKMQGLKLKKRFVHLEWCTLVLER